MKNILFMAVAMATAATFFSSCKKEIVTPTADLSQLSDADLAKKIGDFRTQVLDAKKSGNTQTIAFGDAIYLMEAVFNYYHGFTGEEYAATVTETITLPMGYNTGDEISFTELNSIFVELNNTMVEKFEALKLDNKRTMMFDVELNENGLEVFYTIGSISAEKGGPQECINNAPFTSTDYWLPGDIQDPTSNPNYNPTGQCGQYAGMNVGVSDARNEQEKAARKYRRGNYSSPLYYFADLQTIDGGQSLTGLDGYTNTCISPAEMNQHYQTIGNVINERYYANNIPQRKQFANIRIWNTHMWLYGNFYRLQTIVYSITYGEKKERLQEPELPSFLN
jgi:hypothetical protein